MADPVGLLLFKDKQARLLLMLFNSSKEWHLTDLAKAANVTYVHTSRFITRCEEVGIVETETHGRTKRIFLTEKGKEIAQSLNGIIAKMNQAAQKQQAPQAGAPAKTQPAPAKEAPVK